MTGSDKAVTGATNREMFPGTIRATKDLMQGICQHGLLVQVLG